MTNHDFRDGNYRLVHLSRTGKNRARQVKILYTFPKERLKLWISVSFVCTEHAKIVLDRRLWIENREWLPSLVFARQFFSTSWKLKNMPFCIFFVNFVVKNCHGNYYHGIMVIIERNYSKRHIFQFLWKWKKLPHKTETGEIFSILDPQPYR